MTESFTLTSNERGASFTLRIHNRDFFLAELRHPGLEARAKVGRYMFGGWADFFGTLAQNWNGWKGSREWVALEGELKLSAESDRTGHIRVRVRLDDGAPPNWRTELIVNLEAGELERLAEEARDFERSVLSAT